ILAIDRPGEFFLLCQGLCQGLSGVPEVQQVQLHFQLPVREVPPDGYGFADGMLERLFEEHLPPPVMTLVPRSPLYMPGDYRCDYACDRNLNQHQISSIFLNTCTD